MFRGVLKRDLSYILIVWKAYKTDDDDFKHYKGNHHFNFIDPETGVHK